MNRDSITNTFVVSGLLCIICSVLVSAAAVGLKQKQTLNKELNQKKNILEVCKIAYTPNSIDTLFEDNIQSRLVDLRTGQYVDKTENGKLTVDTYSLKKVLQTDNTILEIDPAGLGGIRENHAVVFLYPEKNQVIIPIRGRGLWSTLFGYISLAEDASTVSGITFYDHRETPGLGGEVEKEWFTGNFTETKNKEGEIINSEKRIRNHEGEIISIKVLKGKADNNPNNKNRFHEVDGISGATVTSNGVTIFLKEDLKRYEAFLNQLRDNGYQMYLSRNEENGII